MNCKKCKINEINYNRSKYLCTSCLEELRKTNHEYYLSHKADAYQRNCERRKRSLEEIRQYKRLWAKNNRDKCNSYRRKRRTAYKMVEENSKLRAKKYRLETGSFTKDEWELILYIYGYKCVACGSNKNIEADHVVPLYEGGTNHIENIQPLCSTCNRKKRTKTIDYRQSALCQEWT